MRVLLPRGQHVRMPTPQHNPPCSSSTRGGEPLNRRAERALPPPQTEAYKPPFSPCAPYEKSPDGG